MVGSILGQDYYEFGVNETWQSGLVWSRLWSKSEFWFILYRVKYLAMWKFAACLPLFNANLYLNINKTEQMIFVTFIFNETRTFLLISRIFLPFLSPSVCQFVKIFWNFQNFLQEKQTSPFDDRYPKVVNIHFFISEEANNRAIFSRRSSIFCANIKIKFSDFYQR